MFSKGNYEQFLFLLFPLCFLPIWKTFCICHEIFKLSSVISFNLEESKFVAWERVNTCAFLSFDPFSHDKTLDQTKLKAFVDDKFIVTKMIISVFNKSRKLCGKRRNCLYRKQFLLFLQCFQKSSFPDLSKSVIKWERVKRMKITLKMTTCCYVASLCVPCWQKNGIQNQANSE